MNTLHASDSGLLRWTPYMSRKIASEVLLYKSLGFMIVQNYNSFLSQNCNSLVNMFPTIIEVLKVVEKDDRDRKNRDQASNLLVYFKSFDFAFYLHLMLSTL